MNHPCTQPGVLLLAVLLGACSASDLPQPRLTGIQPDHRVHLRPERSGPLDAVITGENLAVGLDVDLQTGEVTPTGAFKVWLGEHELDEVEPALVSERLALRVSVPAELPVGVWDVVVQYPGAGQGRLEGAFEVRPVTEVVLETDAPHQPPVAGDRVAVSARVLDNHGETVAATATGDIAFAVETGSGQLLNPRLSDDVVVIDYDTAASPEEAVVRATERLSGNGVDARVRIQSLAGEVSGLAIEPGTAEVTAGETVDLLAWLVDERDNPVPVVATDDITFSVIEGHGALGAAAIAGDAVRIPYTSHTAVEQARVLATEQVSGNRQTAEAVIATRPGEPARLALRSSSEHPVANDPVTVFAELQDGYGNTIPFESTDEFTLYLLAGRGQLSTPALFGGQATAVYSTYRRVETAVIQVEEHHSGTIDPAEIAITTVGGSPAGVTIEPSQQPVGAGQQAVLTGWLIDAFGNHTAADSTGQIAFALNGPGSLGEPVLVDGGLRLDYTAATDPVPGQATVQATEAVTGEQHRAEAVLELTAGPLDHFAIELPAPNVAAGTPFNILLRAQDAYDHQLVDYDGSVAISDTTGTITPTASGPFSAGIRTVTVTIADAQPGVRIQVDDRQGHTGTSPSFDVVGAGIDHFSFDPISDQQAGTPFAVTVHALDTNGNAVEFGGTANLADATGTLFPTSCADFSAGVCTVQVTVTAAEPADTLTASDGLGHTGQSAPFAVFAGPPRQIAFVTAPRNVLRNAVSGPLSIQIRDDWANPSPLPADTSLGLVSSSPTGTFDLDPQGAFDGTLQTVTVGAGDTEATFYYKDDGTGEHDLTVLDPAGSLAGASQPILITEAGQPSRLRITAAPDPLTAGQATGAYSVQIQDAAGTPITSHTALDVSLQGSNPTTRFAAAEAGPFDGTFTGLSIPDGASEGTFWIHDIRAGPLELGVTSPDLIGDSAALTVVGGPVDSFTIEPLPDQAAGQAFTIRIEARDAWDNLAESFNSSAGLADLTGSLMPASTGAFSGGRRDQQVTITSAAASDRLQVDDGAGHTGQSNEFAVQPGLVDHFELAPLDSPQTAGVAFELEITARDAWGNTATGFIGVVDLDDGTGTLVPALSDAFQAGWLSQMVTVTRAATDDVIAVDDGQQHSGLSNPFTVEANALDHFAVGPVPEFVAVATPFDLTLEARDAWDNRVETFNGTVSLADLTGSLHPVSSQAFSAGRRIERVQIDQIRLEDRIEADDGAGHRGQSNPFDVIEPQPAQLVAQLLVEPVAVVEGEGFDVRLQVSNSGDYAVEGVAPQDYTVTGAGTATLLDGPIPSSADIPGRGHATFRWEYRTGLGDTGWVEASARAAGVEADGGQSISSNVAQCGIPVSPASCLLLPLVAEAGDDRVLACGESTVLGGDPTATGGVGTIGYQWDPAGGLDDPQAANPLATPASSARYTVRLQDELDCTDRDMVWLTLADGPTALFDYTPALVCKDDPITFDASASTGAAGYHWEFDDGTQAQGQIVEHAFGDKDWYRVVLTVTDAAGCSDSLMQPVSISDGAEIAGIIPLTPSPETVPADGASTIVVVSDPITKCDGNVIGKDKKIHILATRGRILTPDADGHDGIQVKTPADNSGIISIEIEADRHGGAGRLLIVTEKSERETRGWAPYTFTGSTSLPRVEHFAPSGHGSLPPPRFAVRFDKAMDPASLQSALTVVDANGPVAGQTTWDPRRRTAIFTPADLPDPTAGPIEIRVSAAAMDVWGNPLDGDFDGVADGPDDDFVWDFGAMGDDQAPAVSCNDPDRSPFSPDGDDHEDLSTIRFDADDTGGLWLARLVVQSPQGLPLRTVITLLEGGSVHDAPIAWDGRDDSGSLVDDGFYPYELFVLDAAGNPAAPCIGQFEVRSVMDPAGFP